MSFDPEMRLPTIVVKGERGQDQQQIDRLKDQVRQDDAAGFDDCPVFYEGGGGGGLPYYMDSSAMLELALSDMKSLGDGVFEFTLLDTFYADLDGNGMRDACDPIYEAGHTTTINTLGGDAADARESFTNLWQLLPPQYDMF